VELVDSIGRGDEVPDPRPRCPSHDESVRAGCGLERGRGDMVERLAVELGHQPSGLRAEADGRRCRLERHADSLGLTILNRDLARPALVASVAHRHRVHSMLQRDVERRAVPNLFAADLHDRIWWSHDEPY
jgi:hypothetical protein